MAGHMGNKNCTKFAVRVSISVDVFNNYGSGSVGGASCIAFYDNGHLCLRECSLFLVGGLVNDSNQYQNFLHPFIHGNTNLDHKPFI